MVKLAQRWLIGWGVMIGLLLAGFPVQVVLAQAPIPQSSRPGRIEFQQNPLELMTPDPLLPGGLTRPLSEAERQTLRVALDDLNAQATAKLRSNDVFGAFALWNRELRLRRALGLLEEVQALGRVGDIAWKQNQPSQVRVITNRLKAIQTQLQTPLKNQAPVPPAERAQVLPALGIAYQQVRSPGLALSVYQQMLTEARSRQDAIAEVNLLNTIGQLHLSWFDYPPAIATYTELLNLAKARNDAQNVAANIAQLAYVHEQAKQPAQAATYQQQLVEFYQQNRQLELIPALKIRLADNLAASGQLDRAEAAYQDAFQAAQPLFQLAYATDALKKLGALYRANNRLDAALQVYEYLATVQQQAYDVFGVMDAYDQIGQIQVQRKAFPEALTAFQQGLEAAKQISYRADYFNEQIQKTSQLVSQ